MSKLFIQTDKKYDYEVVDLQQYSCEIKQGYLLVKLITSKGIMSYRISSDEREKDINSIFDYFVTTLKNDFFIRENLVRQYIFVKNADEEKQFTAIKE